MALKKKLVLCLIAVFGVSTLSVFAIGPFVSAQDQHFIPPHERGGRPNRPPRGQQPGQYPRNRVQADQPRFQRDLPNWWANEERTRKRQKRIKRGRAIARRLMNDPNAPASVRDRAQRLDSTLDRIETIERELQQERAAFLRKHEAQRQELRDLRDRMERIRQNLKAAREQAKAKHLPKLQELKRSTEEAESQAQELRQHYLGLRGQRPGRFGHE